MIFLEVSQHSFKAGPIIPILRWGSWDSESKSFEDYTQLLNSSQHLIQV